jgi:hypothetical protein
MLSRRIINRMQEGLTVSPSQGGTLVPQASVVHHYRFPRYLTITPQIPPYTDGKEFVKQRVMRSEHFRFGQDGDLSILA